MERGERRAAMTYAQAVVADAQSHELSALTRVCAGYDGALAAARAVRDLANYRERPDLETFLAAAGTLELGMEWRAEAAEQAKRHNYDARTRAVGEQLPTEADAARTAECAQTIYSAAEAHVRTIDSRLP
ncbi:MAG TPA: hypothetical protein VFN79_02925 [Steroidobacteraceae bacterium]|nr:hypothetical protein [Steroidobacteraceae bacterium]